MLDKPPLLDRNNGAMASPRLCGRIRCPSPTPAMSCDLNPAAIIARTARPIAGRFVGPFAASRGIDSDASRGPRSSQVPA